MGKTFKDKFKTYHKYSEINQETIIERNKHFTQDTEDTFSRQSSKPKIAREYSSRFEYRNSYNWRFIKRWLRSQIGKKWNDVYAMLVHYLPSPDDRKLLEDFLKSNLPSRPLSNHYWFSYFYIDEQGILRKQSTQTERRYRWNKRWENHVVTSHHWYAKNIWTGIWFEITWDLQKKYLMWDPYTELWKSWNQDLRTQGIAEPPADILQYISIPVCAHLKLRPLSPEEIQGLELE